MLDFAAMNRSVGFNHKNQWYFRTSEHDFMFAFNDMVFDRNGFPHERPYCSTASYPKKTGAFAFPIEFAHIPEGVG